MTSSSSSCRAPAAFALAGLLAFAGSAAGAQEVTYLGTVAGVEPARVQVRIVDEKTKEETTAWFVIDKDTKIMRGDKVLALVDARIAKGERIAVIVDPAAKTKMLATELRLASSAAAKAPATKAPEKPAAPPAGGEHAQHPPAGQKAAPGKPKDEHAQHQPPGRKPMPGMPMHAAAPGWHAMQDGVVYALFNRQGGTRGGEEFVVPNWWMGMLMREQGRHQFSLNGMFSLDPATVGKSGYREIFQVGEALEGKPLIDRQHPHDLFMQLAASWRMSLGENTALTVAGGPVGEPTLGPVAFMHRASAAGLVLAPLGHHTFDSTHISFGVVTASIERGRWTFEGSVFNGREPDEDRWDFDLAPMDSVAGRVWFRPADEWEIQLSSGRLREPEELVAGDATRTTTSVSWTQISDTGLKAATFGYGVNAAHGERRHGVFGEATIERGANSVFGRVDFQQVETHLLLTGALPDEGDEEEKPETVTAVTIGAARRLIAHRGFEGALGAALTFYGVPEPLEITHGRRPVSFQLFFRLRLPTTGDMGRMWNMRMSQGHRMEMAHVRH